MSVVTVNLRLVDRLFDISVRQSEREPAFYVTFESVFGCCVPSSGIRYKLQPIFAPVDPIFRRASAGVIDTELILRENTHGSDKN